MEPTYNAAARTLTLRAAQKTMPTPGQDQKSPVLIPIRVALLGADGSLLPLHLKVHRRMTVCWDAWSWVLVGHERWDRNVLLYVLALFEYPAVLQ